MDRQSKVTLHRERNGTEEIRIIDEGTAYDMVAHIMNQPRIKRSEYSIMNGETVIAPNEIENFARLFGLVEDEPKIRDETTALFS